MHLNFVCFIYETDGHLITRFVVIVCVQIFLLSQFHMDFKLPLLYECNLNIGNIEHF